MRVLAIPKFSNRKVTPYNSLLYSEIEAQGTTVGEGWHGFVQRPWRWDVIHMHWPEAYCRGRFSAIRQIVLLAGVVANRFAGGRLVQTVHNVRPHEPVGRVDQRFLNALDRLTRGVLAHSMASGTGGV